MYCACVYVRTYLLGRQWEAKLTTPSTYTSEDTLRFQALAQAEESQFNKVNRVSKINGYKRDRTRRRQGLSETQ